MVEEFEEMMVWNGEIGAAFEMEGLSGDGVGKEAVDVEVDDGYEIADGVNVESVGESEACWGGLGG